MAKSAAGNREKLAASISAIEAEAYERGRADARKALLDRLTAGSDRGAGAGKTSGERAGKAASPARRATSPRAPRGSVRRFVERVLRGHPGATASKISGHAATDIERSVKPASIRNELYDGGKQGRYVSDRGRWSLAVSDPADGDPGQVASPDPSTDDAPGGAEMPDAGSAKGGDPAGPTGSGQGGEGDEKPLDPNP